MNAEPLALPAAGVVSITWVAVPATTLATCTGLPLLDPLLVTTAVRLPIDGAVFNVTVNWVAVAALTVPVPLLRVTVLLAAVVSKPVPAMIRVVSVAGKLLVFEVTVGGAATVADCPVKAMLFKSTLALAELLFAVMMSSLPSPFTSPKVTPNGSEPVAKSDLGPKVPLPLPKSTLEVLAEFAVMMSSLPSPFTSPKVTPIGPPPVAKSDLV